MWQERDGTREEEVEANDITKWEARRLCLIHDQGKLFLVENQSADGSYPKLWDTPDMQAAIAYTGAVIIPGVMCEHDLEILFRAHVERGGHLIRT